MKNGFLPISKEDMREAGIDQLDFVYVCGDAYVDHPSFGHAIISRLLEAHGYKVGIIAQPDWHDKESINILGEPRLGFLVSAGNMDKDMNMWIVHNRKHHRMWKKLFFWLQGPGDIKTKTVSLLYRNKKTVFGSA